MNISSNPTVTIGLPVYNGEKYLKQTIESILGQSYQNFELIICDNASSDATLDICADFAARDSRIQLLTSEINKGAAWNYNRSFYVARGKYFKWAADDDLHSPTFLEKCVEVLDADRDVVLSFTRTIFIDAEGEEIREYEYPLDLETATRRRLFLFYATGGHIVHEIFGVIRSDALRNSPLIGGYVGSDLILLGQLALNGRFKQIPEILFQHREHRGRSAIATDGTQGFTQWYDSSKSGRFAMPRWRRLFESMKSVAIHPMRFSQKTRHWFDIVRGANWNRRALLEDITRLFYIKRKAGS